ncbi:metallophosphoesterase domain-containing protein 1 isoform X2 [Larus michahellis]|uniref:metallophosphoesterase domain-containing protein 1 isoform X2 n=1 Tax=Larus michahellis TaxID=119627 RepID=UPI003D9B1470
MGLLVLPCEGLKPPQPPSPPPTHPPSASGLCLSQPSFPVAPLRSLKKKIIYIYIYAPKLERVRVRRWGVVGGEGLLRGAGERRREEAAEIPAAPLALPPRCSAGARLPPGVRKGVCGGSLPYEYKIVIAGNHELTFDQEFMADLIKQDFYYFPSVSKLKPESYENVQSLLTNCIYLQDSEVTVRGFRIYGSPWQPWFYGWGFNLPRGQALLEKWNLIPDGIDILITHGPPLGFLDWVPKKMQRVGCVELLNTVQRRIQPRLHVFGHIHEGYGVMADGTTTYVNASVCTVNYQPLNPPIVIDLPTPRNT